MSTKCPSFRLALILSFLIALAGFVLGPGRWLLFAGSNDVPNSNTISLCTGIALAWVILFCATAMIYRARALWFLLGAPFVLFWPIMFGIASHRWTVG
jgi:hypothetical protein